jgi:hypothetical protein
MSFCCGSTLRFYADAFDYLPRRRERIERLLTALSVNQTLVLLEID